MNNNNNKHEDTWNVFASCAEDWGFVSTCHEQCKIKAETAQLRENLFSMSDYSTTDTDNSHENLDSIDGHSKDELNHRQNKNLHEDYSDMTKNSLTFIAESAWQLSFASHEINTEQYNDSSDCNELATWLAKGMEKGWLHKEKPLHFQKISRTNTLTEELFWKKLETACAKHRGRFSFVLFKLVQTKGNHNIYDKEYLELMEQIHATLHAKDFFGEIHGFGIALILLDYGVFGATACAERIVSNVQKMLMVQGVSCSLQVSVAERMEGTNADTLFAHAKEAMTMPLQADMCVHVYRPLIEEKTGDSLVQSAEKRFLFFGIQ